MENSWIYDHTPSLYVKSMFYYLKRVGLHYQIESAERRNFNSYLIIYTNRGTGFLKYRGQSHILPEGHACIIDCMDYQYYSPYKDNAWEIYWIHFNGSESKKYVEYILKNNGPVFSLGEESIVLENIKQIASLITEKDDTADIKISCLINEILTEFMILSSKKIRLNNNMPEIVQKAVEIMENRYCMPMNLNSLCKDIGISKTHLARLFKKHTGYSPYEYFISYRINQAKILLRSSELSICEIAEKTGFENSNYFIKVFHMQEGTTPMKFRKYWEQNNN